MVTSGCRNAGLYVRLLVRRGIDRPLEFMKLFEEFDYSPENPMHKSESQVKDGVLCRDPQDPERFFLIGEWKSIEAHQRVLKDVAALRPKFVSLIEGGPAAFKPLYVDVVMSTPLEYLQG